MKLLNYTSGYFLIVLMVIIPIWAGLFYYAMLDEVYDSMDDGLDNQRQLIISKAALDTAILTHKDFEEGNYAVMPVSPNAARKHTDLYIDTMMYMQNEKDFEPVRMLQTVFRKGEDYYQMRVITSMVEEDDLVSELGYSLMWLYFGLVATILVLNNFLLKNIWKPFYRLIRQLQTFKLTNIQQIKMSQTRVDEFNLMQNTVQLFLDNTVSVYNQQKQFIENASHELQTPLAIAINKLELLAEHNSLGDAQAELLETALDNLERLKRLNQSLLLLSKIENDQFEDVREVNVNLLINKLKDDFSDQIDFYKLVFTFSEQSQCIWRMNPDLADIMFSNLIKNAIKHTPQGGIISIKIKSSSISFENEGSAALDESLLFQRFHKISKSESSTGLGLAIAKAIAKVSLLSLNYRYEGKHIFTVTPAV
ncbi:sensor histidine kinase [Daejeonella lutea]|uniref:histidine kinase n=1 Tax=Daejeonella lutea TaxID=572036 RepID=A0A1T5BDN1_9SPHI|nr:HAMP domain-containing sensor histidine kinase [Daejeonella lutea]SKB45120.1 Signal transduction histidine kinase [Daejeonella lutea]